MAVPAPGQPIALGTGFPALDAVLGGLRSGDNVVWQVESIDDYAPLVRPFAAEAREAGLAARLLPVRPAPAPGTGLPQARGW